MTKAEFGKGLAILTACGLGQIEKETVAIWEELLLDLDFADYREAIVNLCKTRTTYFPGDNIPALIRDMAQEPKRRRLNEIAALERKRLLDARDPDKSDRIPIQELKKLVNSFTQTLREKKEKFLPNGLTNTQ